MTDTRETERNLEEDLKIREAWQKILELTAALVITIAALLGNIILCLAVYKVRAIRKIQNYYIVALSTSDFLFIFICVPPSLAALFIGRWPFGDTICQIQGNVVFFYASFSLLNLTLIAINRYVKMVWSVNIYQKMYTKNNVLLSLWACGIFSTLFIIPLNASKFCFHPGIAVCFACKRSDTKEQALLFGSYAVLFAISFPALTLCYYKVFRKVRAHFAQIADSTLNQDALKSFAEEIKITKILFAVLTSFILCWGPAFTIETLDTLSGESTLHRQVYLIISFVGLVNAAINPVIYGFTQKQFRDAYKEILTCTRN